MLQPAPFKTRLKKGDEVIVTTGKHKGQSGKITSVLVKTGRVVVEGVNLVKKHLSARKAMAQQKEPGIVQKAASIAASNVMLKDPKTGKPTRISYRLEADGSKVRVAKGSNTVIDTIKKTGKTATKPAKASAKASTKSKSKE